MHNFISSKSLKFTVLFSLTAVIIFSFSQPLEAQHKEIEIILDCSRSMLDSVEGGRKIDVAKSTLVSVLSQIPENVAVGFRAFSFSPPRGTVEESCRDSALLFPIQVGNRNAVVTKVMSLEAMGATPIGYSLQEAAKDFTPAGGVEKVIILISDGAETCGLDPVGVVQGLRAQGIQIQILTIGFDVDQEAATQLRALSEAAGGQYYSAGTAIELQQSVSEAAQAAVTGFVGMEKPKPQNLDLAHPANGGSVAVATEPKMAQIFGDVPEGSYVYLAPDHEVVVQFQGGKFAELSKVALPIYRTADRNLKEFELLVSRESPTSGFVSLGVFETQNIAFVGNPFQEFVFPQTQAKYLKFKVRSFWGGSWGDLFQLRVFGRMLRDDEVEAKASQKVADLATQEVPGLKKESGPINLALKENGGSVIAATDPSLSLLIDGSHDQYAWVGPGNEAVIAFQDKKKAEISKVAVPILKTSERNLKSFEIQISDKSPTDGFRPIGTFETQNIAFLENPYQEFSFKPVRGKYLKFIPRQSTGGEKEWVELYELQVFGKLIG